jgi:phenylalanyl-tRNA synthetase alpha chain
MLDTIKKIRQEAHEALENIKNLNELEDIKAKFIGKKGELTQLFKDLKSVEREKIREVGQALNEVKTFIENTLAEKKREITSSTRKNCRF